MFTCFGKHIGMPSFTSAISKILPTLGYLMLQGIVDTDDLCSVPFIQPLRFQSGKI